MATQADCRIRYKDALSNFLSELSDIDNEVRWIVTAPDWWLEMKAVEKAVMSALSAAKD